MKLTAFAAAVLLSSGLVAQNPPLQVVRRVDAPIQLNRGGARSTAAINPSLLAAASAVVRLTIAPDGHVAAVKRVEFNAAALFGDLVPTLRHWQFAPTNTTVSTYLRFQFDPNAKIVCVRQLGSTFTTGSPASPPDYPGFGGNAITPAVLLDDIGTRLAKAGIASPFPAAYNEWRTQHAKDGYMFRLTGVRDESVFFSSGEVMDWKCADCSFFVSEDDIGETTNPGSGVVFKKNPNGRSMEATCRARNCAIELWTTGTESLFEPIPFKTATISLPLMTVSVNGLRLQQNNLAGQDPAPIFFHVEK